MNDTTTTTNTTTSLEETCRSLQEQLSEKEESIFELSATLATVQAEANHSVAQVRRETSQRIQAMQQELRRSQREATLLRHDLHMTRTQPPQQPPQVMAPVVSTHERTISTQSTTTTTPCLALYLLSTYSPLIKSPPPPLLVAAAANNNNNSNKDPTTTTMTTTTTFVWQLTEYCLQTDSTPPPHHHHHSDDWKWWKQAMIWSTVCRNLIRASLVSTLEKKKQNRIVVCCSNNNNNNNNTTMMDLEQIAASLLEPKNPTTTPATTSPYVQDLHQRLWNKFVSHVKYLHLVQVVLMDATPQEWNELAWKPLCSSPSSPISRLVVSTATKLLLTPNNKNNNNKKIGGLRYKYMLDKNVDSTSIVVDDDDENMTTLCTALQVLSHSWPLHDDKDDETTNEWQQALVQIILDVLEFVILPLDNNNNKQQQQYYTDLACSMLQVLQTSSLSRKRVEYLQTLVGVYENWATSGTSVVIRLAHATPFPPIKVACLRVLHQVLWHVRRRQEEEPQTSPSFSSLLVECAELHKAVCTQFVLEEKEEEKYPQPIQIMAGMQLQEVSLDEQDVQEQVWSEMAVLGK
jgi:hypothetical protein